jgi:hypothetical protein
MAADPDPPATAGNPPPFTPNDLRISPSGPYIAGAGGGLVRFGADAIVQALLLLDNDNVFGAVPRSASPSAPLAVTFPAFTAGNTLWIAWHLSGSYLPGGDPAPTEAILKVVPTIDTGSGPEFIDNAQVIWAPSAPESVAETSGIALAGVAAFKLTNPAQPPIVQLFYALQTGTTSEISIAGVGPAEAFGSCWLTCAELSSSAVFQLPAEVVLSPFS